MSCSTLEWVTITSSLFAAVGVPYLAILRYRLSQLKKDTLRLQEDLDTIYNKACTYWLEDPSPQDITTEVLIQTKLHDVYTEVIRINKEHRAFSEGKIKKYNDTLNEVTTIKMSRSRQIDPKTAKNIGRTINLYKRYIRHYTERKIGILGAIALAFHKPEN